MKSIEVGTIVNEQYSATSNPYNHRDYQKLPPEISEHLDTKGLDKVRIVSCGQFNPRHLALLKQQHPNLWVIDLREESHVHLIGENASHAIFWWADRNEINLGKTADALKQDEEKKCQELNALKKINTRVVEYKSGAQIVKSHKVKVRFNRAITESELCAELSLPYRRFNVTDHRRPSETQVEEYIKLFKESPADATLLVHCRKGKGRTTTFNVMYDMYLNAKEVKYKKIIRRHSEAGDKYIANVKYPPEDSWKKEFGEARKQLLKDFYDYCLTNRQLSWTDWLQLRQQSPVCQFTTTSIAGVAGTHQAVAQIRP